MAFAGLRHGHIFGLYNAAVNREDVRVIGAWERDAAARTSAQVVMSVPFYPTLDALLADDRVDTLAVGDCYGFRADVILAGLRAGKRIITDKPMCITLAQLSEIEALSLSLHLPVRMMLDLRYDGAMRLARELAHQGELGTIHAVNFTGQHPLDWGVRPMWYFEAGMHGGTINDIAIHGLDAVRWITGRELKHVTAARTWNAFAHHAPDFRDCAQFMAEFTGGLGVTGDVSYAAPSGVGYSLPSYWRFNIWGEKAALECRYGANSVTLASPDGIREVACMLVNDDMLTHCMAPFDQAEQVDAFASQRAALTVQAAADHEEVSK